MSAGSPADGIGHTVGLHPAAHRVDVVAEKDEVVELAVAIGDVPGEQRFGAKAELLEHRDRRALFDGHLRDELLQAELERLREALLDQRTAEAAAAPGGSDEHTQLADVLGP